MVVAQTKNTGPDGGREFDRKGRHEMAIHTPEMTATEPAAADAVTAVTEMADVASLTDADGPVTAAPDYDPATDADGRVVAVWAALTAEPGGSATGIGAAAGLSRMMAGKILNDFEADGRARREPGVSDGGKGRVADRWFPITPAPAATADTAPAADADAPAPAPEVPDTPDVDAAPAPEAEAVPSGIDSADPAPADELTDDEADPAEEAASQVPGEVDVDADGDEPESEPVADDPVWARASADLAELAELFSGVISAKAEGNMVMALGSLEMAMTRVNAVHRTARAALIGISAPARPVPGARPGGGGGAGIGGSVRSGGLRDLVHGHLVEFPDKDFTPYEISRALDRSSGAVANALDRLVQLGDAVLMCERPRRYGLALNTQSVPADGTGTGADAA
jgi:hypothetical protein